jgi:hypothetical protein
VCCACDHSVSTLPRDQDPKMPEHEMKAKFDKLNDEIAAAFESLSD